MAEIVAARIKPKNPVAQEELSKLFAEQKSAVKKQLQRISFWVSLIATLIAFLGGLIGCLATWRSFTLEREIETRLADSVRKINTQESEIVRLNQDLKEHRDHFQRIHGQDIFSIAEGYLLNMAVHKLKFPDKGPTQDRISLYSYDESEEKCFVRLGRFSYNRDFMLSGRKSYPANQGCIAKAWHEGIHFDNGVPDRVANKTEYLKYHQNAQLKREEIQALSMNSRLYFGYRILNKEHKALAVIVVESTEPNRFTRDHLQQIFDSDALFLSHLIGKMSSLLPQPGVATRLGF